MIVFLYGPDTYRLRRYKNELVSRYRNKYPSGINFFDIDFLNAKDTEQLRSAIKTVSFFNEHRLLVCENIFLKKQISDDVLGYVNDYNLFSSHDTTLIIIQDLVEKEMLVKQENLTRELLAKSTTIKLFEVLSDAKLTQWVVEEVKNRNCMIKTQAVQKLISMVGNDSWMLANEIEKLTGYKTDGEISSSDVSLLVVPKVEMDIFELTDALIAKDKNKFIQQVYKEFRTGRDPHYILTMLAYQLRNMVIIKDMADLGFPQSEIARKAGIHPYVVKKISTGMVNFRADELGVLFGKLLCIEVASKNGASDLKDLLYGLYSL